MSSVKLLVNLLDGCVVVRLLMLGFGEFFFCYDLFVLKNMVELVINA